MSRALDVGCSVGRSAFELARGFSEVVGVDYSQSFIRKSQEMKKMGQASYWLTTEGDLGEMKTATVDTDIVREQKL